MFSSSYLERSPMLPDASIRRLALALVVITRPTVRRWQPRLAEAGVDALRRLQAARACRHGPAWARADFRRAAGDAPDRPGTAKRSSSAAPVRAQPEVA